jgi:hypothetical protein
VFLIRWIRMLLSLPFLWAGKLAIVLKLPMDMPLLKAAWYISGNGDTGRGALVAILRHQGPQAAMLQAQLWMQRNPKPEIAAFAGLLTLDAGDLELAKTYLQLGRQAGDEKDGLLDTLEYCIVGRTDGPDTVAQLARQFGTRSDLPADLSKRVLIELLWGDMFQSQWDAAADKAGRLLAVAETPVAQAALWALALRRGDHPAAQKHLAMVKLPTVLRSYYQCLGSAAIGNLQQARDFLAEVNQIDPSLAHRTEAYLRAYKVAL